MPVTRIWDQDNGTWRLVGGTVGAEAAGAGLYLPLSGGTLSGPLYLATNPTDPLQAATKQYVDENAGGGGGGGMPTGVILPFGGPTAPTGFLMCDGAVVSRTTYSTLFSVIGTAYGAGDGSTTFKLPDLIRRFPLGAGTTTDPPRAGTSALGAVGGNINHVHSGPSHTHTGPSHTHGQNAHTHDLGTSAGSGTLTTNTQGAHSHDIPSGTNTSNESHSHSFSDTASGSDSFSTGGPSAGNYYGVGSTEFGPSASHSHSGSVSISVTVSGTTSSHSHNHHVGGISTNTVGNHTHGIATHTHDLGNSVSSGGGTTDAAGTGSTGAAGTGDTSAENPPFQAVNYIIKT